MLDWLFGKRVARLERQVAKQWDYLAYLANAIQLLASQVELSEAQRAALADLKRKSDAVKAAIERNQ